MKKIILVLLVVVFYAGGNFANAQTADKAALLNEHAIRSDNAAVRATRDLWNRVGDRKDESWYKLPKGYLATFTEDGIENRYIYDQRGSWRYTMLTYREDHLPAEVRKVVKSTYYDYSIAWVKEIRQGEDIAYVVHVESDKEWKDVVVQNGEMRVLKAFARQ